MLSFGPIKKPPRMERLEGNPIWRDYLSFVHAAFFDEHADFFSAHAAVFSAEQAFFSAHSAFLAVHSALSSAYAEKPAIIRAAAATVSTFFMSYLLTGLS